MNDIEAHDNLGYGGRVLPTEQPHLPHFGLVIATCERGDLRLSPDGIAIHDIKGTREIAIERGIGRPGQGDALDALWAVVRDGRKSVHDTRWGKATVEAVFAIVRSARERCEVSVS